MALKKHLKICNQPNEVQCQECQKNITAKAMRDHMESIHGHITGEHKCSKANCGKYFTDKHLLQKHVLRHDKTKPLWRCEDCGKVYKRREGLVRHRKKVHDLKDEKA